MIPSVILSVKITKYLRKYEELEGEMPEKPVKPKKFQVAESRSNTPSDVKLEPRSWSKPTKRKKAPSPPPNKVAPSPTPWEPSPEPFKPEDEFKFKY